MSKCLAVHQARIRQFNVHYTYWEVAADSFPVIYPQFLNQIFELVVLRKQTNNNHDSRCGTTKATGGTGPGMNAHLLLRPSDLYFPSIPELRQIGVRVRMRGLLHVLPDGTTHKGWDSEIRPRRRRGQTGSAGLRLRFTDRKQWPGKLPAATLVAVLEPSPEKRGSGESAQTDRSRNQPIQHKTKKKI